MGPNDSEVPKPGLLLMGPYRSPFCTQISRVPLATGGWDPIERKAPSTPPVPGGQQSGSGVPFCSMVTTERSLITESGDEPSAWCNSRGASSVQRFEVPEALRCHLGVDACRGDVLVAEVVLNRSKIRARPIHQAIPGAVSQRVGCDRH